MKTLLAFLLTVTAFAQPKPPLVVNSASFLQDVYAISPYGDVALMNPMYWATGDAAAAICRRINATPVQRDTTPQTGAAFTRWHVSRVSASLGLLPPPGLRVADPQRILLLIDLPKEKMWAGRFATGCEINLGFLLDYFKRNPEDKYPGVAQHYVDQVIPGECATGLMAKAKVKRPSVFADGKERRR